jgi:pimeloyl-ACP methyl ester carboxylesterase
MHAHAEAGLTEHWELIDRSEPSRHGSADAFSRPGQGCASYAPGPGFPGTVEVPFYRPAGFGRDSPILCVMAGTRRNATDYRDTWTAAAERYGCLVICPEFPRARYPRALYQLGGVRDADGAPRPRQGWTFAVVEGLFDFVRAATGNASAGYHLYGHSAGGQFVHRLALLRPESRFVVAAAANAGWYTMPTFRASYPYGLGGTGVTEEALRGALDRRLVVLAGEDDTESDHGTLRNSTRARRQGRNRLERAQAFDAAVRASARRLGVASSWELVTVPEAGHSDGEMMEAAAEVLFGGG